MQSHSAVFLMRGAQNFGRLGRRFLFSCIPGFISLMDGDVIPGFVIPQDDCRFISEYYTECMRVYAVFHHDFLNEFIWDFNFRHFLYLTAAGR